MIECVLCMNIKSLVQYHEQRFRIILNQVLLTYTHIIPMV